jgi:hypothetical protein
MRTDRRGAVRLRASLFASLSPWPAPQVRPFTDSLTEILRNGARALLTQAVETEVADFLERYADLKTEAGHQRVVRHGHLPEREIMTGIGPVAVRQPRVRDREAVGGELGQSRA